MSPARRVGVLLRRSIDEDERPSLLRLEPLGKGQINLFEGQHFLWKARRFLTIKVTLDEPLSCLSVSARDSNDMAFEPLFLDAAKMEPVVAITLGFTSRATFVPWEAAKRAALASFVLRRLALSRGEGGDRGESARGIEELDERQALTLEMTASDSLRAEELIFSSNPGVKTPELDLSPPSRVSVDDFEFMMQQVDDDDRLAAIAVTVRDSAECQRRANVLRLLNLSMVAFKGRDWRDAPWAKVPWAGLPMAVKVRRLLRKFARKHVLAQVQRRLGASAFYERMRQEDRQRCSPELVDSRAPSRNSN